MAKYKIEVKCTMKEIVELEREPTGNELLEVLADVNDEWFERGVKVKADTIKASLIVEPVEEE